jgi:Fe2+ or Zn2+ uptake regulation protein
MSQTSHTPHEQLIGRIRQVGLRLTKQRIAMANMISLWGRPFTSAELIRDLNRSGMGMHRATVFRDLDHLVKKNILREVQVAGERGRYFVIAHERSGHFLVCERCGLVVAVDRGEIMPVLKQWTELASIAKGWKVKMHEVESYGMCPDCRAEQR